MKHSQFARFKNLSTLCARGIKLVGRLEFILVGTAFVGAYLILANYALGGPLASDVLGYMNAGLHNTKSAFVLNRYFHIFLEKIFLEVAPTPLTGVQHYWAFLIAGTAFLIYVSARLFSPRSTFLHAVFAIAIFFSIPAIGKSTGIAVVDITAMFMVALLMTVYLLSIRRDHSVPALIVLWGSLLYLALRTKETTLIAWILLAGFGIQDGKWNSRVLMRNCILIATGFLAGILLFAVWNSIVLHDFFFGLRIADIQRFLNTYVKNSQSAQPSGLQNWYNGFIFSNLLLPFLLYLVSAIKGPEADVRSRLILLMPLLLIVFITITVDNQWGFPYRLFMPAFPAIAVVSPQVLALQRTSPKGNLHLGLSLFLGLLAVLALRTLLRIMAPHWGWDIAVLMEVVVEPILLTLFLLAAMVEQSSPIRFSVLLAILVMALLVTPLRRNYKVMFVQRPNWEYSQRMFYPFSAFEKELQYTPNLYVYITSPIWETLETRSVPKGRDEIIDAYNVYFDSYARLENFYITSTTEPQALLSDILTTNYTHVVLRVQDWQNIQKIIEDDPLTGLLLDEKYEMIPEPKNILVLLKATAP